MSKSLLILGRQPAISLAELESRYNADLITPFGSESAILDMSPHEIKLATLGGCQKLCEVLTTTNQTDWKSISSQLNTYINKITRSLPEGKIKLGLSVYGVKVSTKSINATALKIKKDIKSRGRTVRIVPNNTNSLNTAQVLYNKLTTSFGLEVIVASNGTESIIALTRQIQDINAYASRDQNRPKRDARVGMLPPKLAQIIINLANSLQSSQKLQQKILDPFCGTGVILQEALIMGYDVYGTDIDPRMLEYSKINLDWLHKQLPLNFTNQIYLLETGDSCNVIWQQFDTIATETYLGSPFSVKPNAERLNEVIKNTNTIHKKFLQNVTKQTKPGFRMCIAVPAWFSNIGLKRLPILDQLTDMGYTRMSFVHAQDKDLIYHRENQIVGRELVVLIRN